MEAHGDGGSEAGLIPQLPLQYSPTSRGLWRLYTFTHLCIFLFGRLALASMPSPSFSLPPRSTLELVFPAPQPNMYAASHL